MKKLLIACSIVVCLTACDDKPSKTEVSPNAWSNVTEQGYPKLYKEWGSEVFERINKFGPLALNKLAETRKCKKIDYLDISISKSTPEHIVYFADCNGGKRFYISSDDLESNRNIQSNDEILKSLDKEKYYNSCKSLIMINAMNPSTVDTSVLNREINVSPTQEIVVKIPFTAKNKFNAESKFSAECTFKTKYSEPTITIFQK